MKYLKYSLLAVLLLLSSTVLFSQTKIGDKGIEPSVSTWHKTPMGENFKDKPIVIDFFATWCGPCRNSVEHFESLASKYKDKVAFMVLSSESIDKIDGYFTSLKKEFTFNIGIDNAGKTSQAYGVTHIPYCAVLNKDRKIIWVGFTPNLTETIIQEALK